MKLILGDCLEKMDNMIAQGVKVDAIITDPPYGTTACKWDSVIPFDAMWERLNKLIKPNGAIVLFGSEPFSSALRMSNIKNYKYDWTWKKNFSTNFLHAKRQPLRCTENISVFIKGCSYYYPIKTTGHTPTQSAKGSSNGKLWHGNNIRDYKGGDMTRFPKNLLEIKAIDPKKKFHPTQKPVALMEYLVKTYTNEGETVLDFTMGSGTTGVACVNTGRDFIGIELNDTYFQIAKDRIQNISVQKEIFINNLG